MCITVERAHFDQLAKRIRETIAGLVADAPSRGSEFLLELDPGFAEAAIVFRDFPKAHGNIIRDAVGVALCGHVGGIAECERKFSFLSGSTVSVDNFFMSSCGQIYLFETKRDFNHVRADLRRAATLALYDVARLLETEVFERTGKRLRHPIQRVFFSYIDKRSPSAPVSLNIGTNQTPLIVSMQVFGRQEMNRLIGPCFARFVDSFDDFVGRQIGEVTKGVHLRHDREVTENPLYEGRLTDTQATIHFGAEDAIQDEPIHFGTEECQTPSESDVLE